MGPSSRRRRIHRFGTALGLAGALAVLAACSSGSTPAASGGASPAPSVQLSTKYPNAVVVMGEESVTAWNSNTDVPDSDFPANSWATGTNPAVNSIYQRLVALNPALKGHATNLGTDDSKIDGLAAQLDSALALDPLPGLFMIEEDSDMACDGTDAANYPVFASILTAGLNRIVAKAPQARILVVGGPAGTSENFVAATKTIPDAVQGGTGPCDLWDTNENLVPAHGRLADKLTEGYLSQKAAVCKKFPTCRYDGGDVFQMKITSKDLSFDGHLGPAGQAKQAELEWKVLGYES